MSRRLTSTSRGSTRQTGSVRSTPSGWSRRSRRPRRSPRTRRYQTTSTSSKGTSFARRRPSCSATASRGAYVVASATCDAVIRPRPRRGSILLLPVVPRTIEGFDGTTPAAKANVAGRRLEQLLTFRTTGALYLPPLIDDGDDVVFNEIRFNHFAALESAQIPTVQRVHSMSLIGWRAFAALLRLVITRTGDEEVGFRLVVAERRATG